MVPFSLFAFVTSFFNWLRYFHIPPKYNKTASLSVLFLNSEREKCQPKQNGKALISVTPFLHKKYSNNWAMQEHSAAATTRCFYGSVILPVTFFQQLFVTSK